MVIQKAEILHGKMASLESFAQEFALKASDHHELDIRYLRCSKMF